MSEYNVLSLFSGGLAGLCDRAISLAQLDHKFKVRQFVEYVPYRQHLLKQNFPGIAIWDDVKTFHTKPGRFDIVCGGSPCQSNSLANPKRNGLSGRSGLWWEMYRIISEDKPRLVLWENPSGCRYPTKNDHTSPLGHVLWSLNRIGYVCQWQTISAAEVGAPHKRDRVFIIAYPHNDVQIRLRAIQSPWSGQIRDAVKEVRSNTTGTHQHSQLTRMGDGYPTGLNQVTYSGWWQSNPYTGDMAAVARSLPQRSERVAILGDGCTPQQAAVCWKYINYLLP